VQKLTGSLAALSRFISRLAKRALPFFKLLRKSGLFTWTEEAEQAFHELKQHLTNSQCWWHQSQVRRCLFTLQRRQKQSAWC